MPKKAVRVNWGWWGSNTYKTEHAKYQSKAVTPICAAVIAMGILGICHERQVSVKRLGAVKSKYKLAKLKKMMPRGKTELKGNFKNCGNFKGSRTNVVPPTVSNPTQKLKLQKAIT